MAKVRLALTVAIAFAFVVDAIAIDVHVCGPKVGPDLR